jgi:hypothetical protein
MLLVPLGPYKPAALARCWSRAQLDVWVQVPVLGDFQGGGGYDAWYYNATRSCVAMASAQ